jgi:hypothetical protein
MAPLPTDRHDGTPAGQYVLGAQAVVFHDEMTDRNHVEPNGSKHDGEQDAPRWGSTYYSGHRGRQGTQGPRDEEQEGDEPCEVIRRPSCRRALPQDGLTLAQMVV